MSGLTGGRKTRGLVDGRVIDQDHFIDKVVGQFPVRLAQGIRRVVCRHHHNDLFSQKHLSPFPYPDRSAHANKPELKIISNNTAISKKNQWQ